MPEDEDLLMSTANGVGGRPIGFVMSATDWRNELPSGWFDVAWNKGLLKKASSAEVQARQLGIQTTTAILVTPTETKKKFRLAKKSLDIDYLQMADEFLETQPLYYDDSKLWWEWNTDKTCWEQTDETNIMNQIDGQDDIEIHDTINADTQGKIIRALQRRSRLRAPAQVPDTWVQYKNVIIDIKDGSTRQASPHYFCTNPIPWELGKTSSTPVMDALFEEWVGKEYVQQLYEFLAFCTVPSYFVQRIFSFVGSGSNGKSTYLSIVRKFIGEGNYTDFDIDQLGSNKFETSKLYKKLLAFVSETNFGKMSNTNKLKALSSGLDTLGAEFKGKDSFCFTNYAKVVIATNTLPDTQDTTPGFYRRWLVIDWPKQFEQEKDILSSIPEHEYNALGARCATIAMKLYRTRTFTNEGSIDERKGRYEARSNPLKRFIDENCLKDPNGFVASSVLQGMFEAYCVRRSLRKWNYTEFGKAIADLGCEKVRRYTGKKNEFDEEVRTWAYQGLVLKTGQLEVSNFSSIVQESNNVHSVLSVLPVSPICYNQLFQPKNRENIGHLGHFEENELFSLLKTNKAGLTVSELCTLLPAGYPVEQVLAAMKARGDVMEDSPGHVRLIT